MDKNKYEIEYTLWDKLTRPYWRVSFIIKDWKYEVKWAYQRIIRGYDDRALWNLEYHLAKVIKEVTFQMAENSNGYPHRVGSEKKWKQILLDISFGFGSYIEMDWFISNQKEYKVLDREFKKGMKLFAEYFKGLWD